MLSMSKFMGYPCSWISKISSLLERRNKRGSKGCFISGMTCLASSRDCLTSPASKRIIKMLGTHKSFVPSIFCAFFKQEKSVILSDYTQKIIQPPTVVNGTNTFLISALDVSAYKWASLTINGVFTLTAQFQQCNTNVDADFSSFIGWSHNGQFITTTITGPDTIVFPITDQWLRVKCTAFTSNTSLGGILNLYATPPPPVQLFASQAGMWTMQPTGISTAIQQNKNGTATAGTATATLTGAANVFTYITGMEITIIDTATAGSAELTLSGLAGGSVLYEINAQGVAGTGEPWAIEFGYPGLQSSAQDTNIVATMPTLGAGTGKVSIVLHGYTL